MADERKRTGGEPVFDTDRAWERFEKKAGGTNEELQARWERLQHQFEKEGAGKMKQKDVLETAQEAPAVMGEKTIEVKYNTADSSWRAEKPGRRRLRRLASGAAAAVVAVSLFTTPLGDRALAAMMQTFRVQHMVGVGISADDLTAISNLLERGSPEGDQSFSLAQFGSLTQSGGGESRAISWREADERLGGSLIRLTNASEPEYQPESSLTFKLNVQAVNRMLTRLGSPTTLPAQADGKAIILDVPDGIASEGTLSGKPVRLLQFGKPVLTVEGGIDPATVREAILGLPVLPDSLRTKLAAIGDWQTTLPVPAYEGITTAMKLGGYDALLVADGNTRYVFWLEGDRMGLLSGATQDFPTEAAFRKAAEELVRP